MVYGNCYLCLFFQLFSLKLKLLFSVQFLSPVCHENPLLSISGDEITFKEPIMHEVDAQWNWKLRKYSYYENVGVEDLTFVGHAVDDFYAAEATCRVEPGKMNRTLYHQAGNSIPVPIFESMFSAMLNSGIIRKEGIN